MKFSYMVHFSLQIKHDDIKLKNAQLKLEIQRNENNSETNFFNQVVNRRSEIILQQKIDLETENNLLKKQNNEYLLKNKDLNTEIQACKDEILQHSNIIDNLKVEKLLVTENFENFKKLTSAKQNESEQKIFELEANIADKVNEHQLQLDQLNKKIKTEFDDFENLKNNLNIKLNQIEQLNELIKQEKSLLAEENKKLNDDFGNYKQSTDTKQNKTERRINELEQEKSTLLACLKEKENQHHELLLSSNLLTENNNNLNEKLNTYEQEMKVIEQEKLTLKIDFSQKNKENENLSTKIMSMTEKNKKLQDQVSLLNHDLSDQSTQIKVLIEEKNKLCESNEARLNEKCLQLKLIKQQNETQFKKILEKNSKFIQDLNESHEKELAFHQTRDQDLKNSVENLMFKNNSLSESNKFLISDLERAQEILKSDLNDIKELNFFKKENENKIQILKSSILNLELELKNLNDENILINEDSTKLREHHENQITLFKLNEQELNGEIKRLKSENEELYETKKKLKDILSNKIKNDSAYFEVQNSIKSENKQSNIQSDSNNNYKRKLSNETDSTKKNETKV